MCRSRVVPSTGFRDSGRRYSTGHDRSERGSEAMNGAASEPVFACPRCGAEIKVTETLAAPMIQALRQKLEAEKKTAAEQAKSEGRREAELELKSAKDDAAAKSKLLAEAQKNELELRKDRHKLEEERRAFDLEVQRKLDAQRNELEAKLKKDGAEQQKLRDEQQ